jgi:hypothetical protein
MWLNKGYKKTQEQIDAYKDEERRGVPKVQHNPPPERREQIKQKSRINQDRGSELRDYYPLASLQATWCEFGSFCDSRWDCKLKHCGLHGFCWHFRGHKKSQAQMDLYADQERRGVPDVEYCPPEEMKFSRPKRPPTPNQIAQRQAKLRKEQECKEREVVDLCGDDKPEASSFDPDDED